MTEILDEGIKPLTKQIIEFIPDLKALQCGTDYAKKLGALPAYLASALPSIVIKTNSSIQSDGFGWYYPVTKDGARVSLVIAIINSDKTVCTYERKGNDIGKEQNKNIGIDAIGSKGYGINGLYDKVPAELWNIKIKSAKIAQNMAWEKTDGINDCKNVSMPVILIELEENPLCSVPINEIDKPTAKMEVVIKELQNTL